VVALRASTAARLASALGLSNPPRLATAAASAEIYAVTGAGFAAVADAVAFSATVSFNWLPSARGLTIGHFSSQPESLLSLKIHATD